MSWKDNVYGVQSFKHVISRWLGGKTEGGTRSVLGRYHFVKAEEIPKFPPAFDLDGKHPLHKHHR